jgi:trimethylamine--corrinoid protein Co-methyltransferase
MLGSVLRMVRGIEISDDTLSLDAIADVNLKGPGHYLGHTQTIDLMESEYHYPPLSDRRTPEQWQSEGGRTMLDRARDYVEETLDSHYPEHVSPELDAKIRERFDIRLPRQEMTKGCTRWPGGKAA